LNITVTDQQQCKKQLRLEIPGETIRAETDKIATDLAAKGSAITEADIKAKLDEFLAVAVAQVKAGT